VYNESRICKCHSGCTITRLYKLKLYTIMHTRITSNGKRRGSTGGPYGALIPGVVQRPQLALPKCLNGFDTGDHKPQTYDFNRSPKFPVQTTRLGNPYLSQDIGFQCGWYPPSSRGSRRSLGRFQILRVEVLGFFYLFVGLLGRSFPKHCLQNSRDMPSTLL